MIACPTVTGCGSFITCTNERNSQCARCIRGTYLDESEKADRCLGLYAEI